MKTPTLAVLVTLATVGRAFAQNTAVDPNVACPPPPPPAAAAEPAPAPVAEPAPAPAPAQPETAVVPPPPPAEPSHGYYDWGHPKLVTGIGLGVLIGGAVNSFFGPAAMDASKVGAGWDARVELGTRSHLGGEFAYEGTTNELTTLGINPNGQLLSNGAQGLLRLNVLTGPLQPYAGVGIGYKRYQVVNTSVNTSDIANREDVATVPAAFGLAFRGMGLILDTRFAVNAPISASMIPGSAMTSWNVGANIGAEF